MVTCCCWPELAFLLDSGLLAPLSGLSFWLDSAGKVWLTFVVGEEGLFGEFCTVDEVAAAAAAAAVVGPKKRLWLNRLP